MVSWLYGFAVINTKTIYIYNIANQHTTNTLIYIYIIFNQRTIEYDEPYFLQYEQLLIMNTQNYMEMIPINY
jgi:hypothetical protein